MHKTIGVIGLGIMGGAFAKNLAAAGWRVVGCDVEPARCEEARAAGIAIVADAAAIKRLEPVFLGFARKVHDLGAFGNGSKMKFVANHLVAIHNVVAAEAMVLGMKAGLDPHRIVEVVSSGAGTSRVFELRAPMMAESTYLPASMRSATWTKDLTVIGDFASSLACPTPLFGLSASLHAAVLATGHGADDTAAVCAVYEEMAGLDRAKRG